MKRQIRRGVFETNSSSTHSLAMCTEEEFNKWKNGELLFDKWNEELVKKVNLTKEQKADAEEEYMDKKDVFQKDWSELSDVAKDQYYKKYAQEYYIIGEGLQTYSEWENDYELSAFERYYTTPNGEKIIAFGKYGYN